MIGNISNLRMNLINYRKAVKKQMFGLDPSSDEYKMLNSKQITLKDTINKLYKGNTSNLSNIHQ